MSEALGSIRIVEMPDIGGFTSDSSVVGEHAGSGRFGAKALRQYINNSVVNVLDYGAVGDGYADDTGPIQNTLNAFAGKATVLIPDTGSPYVVTGLLPPSGTDLLIHGRLLLRPLTAAAVINAQSVSGITIRGYGTVDGNRTHQTAPTGSGAPCGVAIQNCSNVLISGITIQHSFYWNLNVVTCTHVTVDSVTMLDGGASNEFAAGSDDCWLTNCLIDGVDDIGFSFYGGVTNSGAVGNTVRHTRISGTSPTNGIGILGDAAQLAACKNIVISNNVVHNCSGGGIYHDTAGGPDHDTIVISNNVCHDNAINCTLSGIVDIGVNNCTNVMISGNISANFGKGAVNPAGLFAGPGARGVAIVGNQVFNVGQTSAASYGMWIDAANILMASGNYFYDQPDTTTQMTAAITGYAGLRNSYIGNFCDRLIDIQTTQPDTVFANAINGQWQVGSGNVSSNDIYLAVTTVNGQKAMVDYQVGGVSRWHVGTDGLSETGTNHGSNFVIASRDDTGAPLAGYAIEIDRASSIVTFDVAPQIFTPPLNFVDDNAARIGGLPVGAIYRNGSQLMIRVT